MIIIPQVQEPERVGEERADVGVVHPGDGPALEEVYDCVQADEPIEKIASRKPVDQAIEAPGDQDQFEDFREKLWGEWFREEETSRRRFRPLRLDALKYLCVHLFYRHIVRPHLMSHSQRECL